MSQSPNITVLLDQAGWIQSLAHSLVTDPNLADDIVQQTWIDALEHQPDTDTSVRGWLATVLRNNLSKLRRGDANRASREQLVSADERVDSSAHDVIERAATHRDLVLAVMDLEEPYRSTILLRFFEGLSYVDIARRQQVTRAAVNSRITRGLEHLRRKLEKSYGDRPSTLRALAPLAFCRPEGAVPLATGVKLMHVVTGIAAVGLAVTATTQFSGSGSAPALVAVEPQPEVQEWSWTPGTEELEEPATREPVLFEVEQPQQANFSIPVDPTADLSEDQVWETELFDSRNLPAEATQIRINTGAGRVQVERASGRALEIDAHIRADLDRADPSKMTQYFEDHVTIDMEDKVLVIEDAHADGDQGWSVSLTVRVPAALPIQANSGAGEVVVLYAASSIQANSGAGTVRIEVPNETVGSVQANTGAGEVHVDVAAVSGTLLGNSGAGKVAVRVRNVSSNGKLELNSGAGDVHLTVPHGVAGKFDIRADLGQVEVPASLGLEVTKSGLGARARGTIGGSEALYKLQSGVGSIRVDHGDYFETR